MPHPDSDHEHLDRAMDDLATGDPFDLSYELPFGLNHVAVIAATQASARSAGSPADARATTLLPLRGLAGLSDL